MPIETFFTPSEQTVLFLWSVLLGAFLGVVFDVFRVLRAFIPHGSIAVAVEDILFALIWGASLLIFSIEFGGGEVRFFCLAGSVLGFSVYILTVGQIIIGTARGVSSAVRHAFTWLYRMFVLKIARVFVSLYQMLKPVFVNIYLIFKKRVTNRKNRLKSKRGLLYNNHRKFRLSGKKKAERILHGTKKRNSSGKGCERIEKDGCEKAEGNGPRRIH